MSPSMLLALPLPLHDRTSGQRSADRKRNVAVRMEGKVLVLRIR